MPANRARAAGSRKRAPGQRRRPGSSAGSPKRASASGWRGRRHDGPQERRQRARPTSPDERPEEPPPGARRRRRAPRQRVAAVDGCAPGRPPGRRRADGRPATSGWTSSRPRRGQVERLEERRGERQRVDRRAHVVTEPGQRQLGGPRPAADRRRPPRRPGPSGPARASVDRRGEAVRPGPDDDGVDGRRRAAAHGTGSSRRSFDPGRSASGPVPSPSDARTGSSRCCGRCASGATAGCGRCRRLDVSTTGAGDADDGARFRSVRLPELVVLAVAAQHVGELVERVDGPLERLRLDDLTSPSRCAENVIHAERVWPSGVMNVNDSSSA